jgi:hypothetical protein
MFLQQIKQLILGISCHYIVSVVVTMPVFSTHSALASELYTHVILTADGRASQSL